MHASFFNGRLQRLNDDVMYDVIAEDVDPSVGRFRNMIQTAVVPIKVSSRTTMDPLWLRGPPLSP